MALRYTRASVKGNDAFSQMQASENFVPARESGKQILGGKLGSTIVPNNGVTTRGGLRSTNTKTTAPSAGLSRQIAELRAPGTSHLGLRSSIVPSSKPSDVPLKSVCYTCVTFHFSYYFILVFISRVQNLPAVQNVPGNFSRSAENDRPKSDSSEIEKDGLEPALDVNVQLHAKAERQPSAMEISPEHNTQSDNQPPALETLVRAPIHSIDSVDLVHLPVPSFSAQKSLERSISLKSNSSVVPELCRRLECFSIFKEAVPPYFNLMSSL